MVTGELWLLIELNSHFLVSLSLTIIMAGSGDAIQLFKLAKKTYQNIGLIPPQSNQKRCSFSAKNWIFLCCLLQYLSTSTAYALFDANSMIECGMAFYLCISLCDIIIFYLILFWQMRNILNYIER